ncbi:MAG: glycosyltransferase family 2 protein, partial [Vulcanimicrobiota bacterium]
MDIDISVQISTYNRKDLVVRTVRELFEQDYPKDKYEIVVIDDGSSDDTCPAVNALEAPCNLICERMKHSGIAKTRNRGAELAHGKYILFLDDDMVPSPTLISGHMKVHREYPGSVVKGWVNHVEDLENIKGKKPEFTIKDYASAFFLGGNGSLAKADFIKAGGFDEDFREYGWEDLELGFKLRNMGLVSRFSKEAVGFHYKTRWKKDELPGILKQARAKGRTAVIFLNKHNHWRIKLATGIYGPRLLLNNLVNFFGKKLFEGIIEKYDKEELTGLALFSAHQLFKFEYFNA